MNKVLRYDPLNSFAQMARDYIVYQMIVVEGKSEEECGFLNGISARRCDDIATSIAALKVKNKENFDAWYKVAELCFNSISEEADREFNKEEK